MMSVDAPLNEQKLVTLGRITGLYGVKGWVKVFSETDPREGIANYSEWLLKREHGWQPIAVESGRKQGKNVVVKLAGIDDRDTAATLSGCEIAITRDQLAAAKAGEYYWIDLEGLKVVTTDGAELGIVDHLFETGANDVLVVREEGSGAREHLIPYVSGEVVTEVDLQESRMTVDWDPEF
jgi:16S rRNA processing protein RimM